MEDDVLDRNREKRPILGGNSILASRNITIERVITALNNNLKQPEHLDLRASIGKAVNDLVQKESQVIA